MPARDIGVAHEKDAALIIETRRPHPKRHAAPQKKEPVYNPFGNIPKELPEPFTELAVLNQRSTLRHLMGFCPIEALIPLKCRGFALDASTRIRYV
jgi:hypothetical protein